MLMVRANTQLGASSAVFSKNHGRVEKHRRGGGMKMRWMVWGMMESYLLSAAMSNMWEKRSPAMIADSRFW